MKFITRPFEHLLFADLPSIESKHNDIEIAANAPHSESLMRKIGSNVNALIDDNDSQDSSISANAAAIAANTALINSKPEPEFFNSSLVLTSGFQIVYSFSSTPTLLMTTILDVSNVVEETGTLDGTTTQCTLIAEAGTLNYQIRLSGSDLEARISSGTPPAGATRFIGFGFI